MDGAFALDCSDLKGRELLNLDSEEEGVFTVSCAGGVRLDCALDMAQEALPAGTTGYRVTISGLKGGHSGMNINQGRGNANCLMGRTLYSGMEKCPSLRVHELAGGQFDNVICLRNDALVAVSEADAPTFEAFIREFDATLKNEYAVTDDGISLSCEKTDVPTALSAAETSRILHVLLALPQGVQEMSADFPGLVQTSLNLGILTTDEQCVQASFCVRSSVATQKEMLVARLRCLMAQLGGTVAVSGDYPAWEYRKDSPLRERMVAVFREQYGRDPKVEAIHAGVECGLFAGKLPGLDCVSFGPDLTEIHTCRERMHITSVQRVWRYTLEVLRRCK